MGPLFTFAAVRTSSHSELFEISNVFRNERMGVFERVIGCCSHGMDQKELAINVRPSGKNSKTLETVWYC